MWSVYLNGILVEVQFWVADDLMLGEGWFIGMGEFCLFLCW